jgi:hypothetical protein
MGIFALKMYHLATLFVPLRSSSSLLSLYVDDSKSSDLTSPSEDSWRVA